MVKHPEWGSSQDPRHLAGVFDERNNTLRPVSSSFNAFYNTMPEEIKKRVLINRRIQRVYEQFSQVVDPFILEHTNSVYLLRHKDLLSEDIAPGNTKHRKEITSDTQNEKCKENGESTNYVLTSVPDEDNGWGGLKGIYDSDYAIKQMFE